MALGVPVEQVMNVKPPMCFIPSSTPPRAFQSCADGATAKMRKDKVEDTCVGVGRGGYIALQPWEPFWVAYIFDGLVLGRHTRVKFLVLYES